MKIIKQNSKVKMTDELKKILNRNGSKDHVREFGDCEGLVEDIEYQDSIDIEVNVRWMPSKLRYSYNIKYLKLI